MTRTGDGGLSHYRLERRLGAGGMGEVFLAHDTELERDVAIKILAPELARDPHHRKRFRTEAKAASALAHPNICVIHEVGETEDGRPFLAMEYVAGQTLHEVLAQRRLPIRDAVRLGLEIAEALAAAHDRGIIHRDIKPGNIMIDSRGHAKVLDFGLAKRVRDDALIADTASASLTQTGAVLGSPFYMSPEQALGRELDTRTDVFSLGAMLYEVLAGQKPFLGRTAGEAMNNVINQQPHPLALADPFYAPALEKVVFKCLEKDPSNRYPSGREVAEDLAKVLADAESATHAATQAVPAPDDCQNGQGTAADCRCVPVSRLRQASWIVGVAALLVLIGVAWWWIHPRAAQSNLAAEVIPQKSIAVLPFANIGGEPGFEYLSDGLAEEITSALSRIPGLKVAARNSAYAFRGKQMDERAIARTLRVSTLLEGSVQKAGKQLRVTARLVNALEGYVLWSETYERSLDDILKVQEEIALQIAGRLQTGTPASPARRYPGPEAYRKYLLARQEWNKRTESGLTNAIELFKNVIGLDPKYADAHAGLASTYLVLPNYAPVSMTNYLSRAHEEARLALELNPACAEAHAVLGQWHWMTRDLKAAEQSFLKALELDPNYATARHWYSQFLTMHGRPAEGRKQLDVAASLDPLSPVIRACSAEWYHITGDVDGAIREARSVVTAHPEFPLGYVMLSCGHMRKGSYDAALRELDAARALVPDKPLFYLDMKAYVFARSGREAEAREILSKFENGRQEGKPLHGSIALIYLGLHEYEKAIDALETLAATEGLPDSILCDPFLEELKSQPRFQGLLQRYGLGQVETIRM